MSQFPTVQSILGVSRCYRIRTTRCVRLPHPSFRTDQETLMIHGWSSCKFQPKITGKSMEILHSKRLGDLYQTKHANQKTSKNCTSRQKNKVSLAYPRVVVGNSENYRSLDGQKHRAVDPRAPSRHRAAVHSLAMSL